MKKLFLLSIVFLVVQLTRAQQIKENSQELSKIAQKGVLDDVVIDENGNIICTYKMKTDKNSDVLSFENYVFDSNLNFKGIEPDKKQKEQKENEVLTSISAFVGGGNSFNVMSMNLTLQKEVWERNWDYRKQQFVWGKRLSKETVKPKNTESKYKGFASYQNDEDGAVLIIASAETNDKKAPNQFYTLYVTNDLSLKETAFPVKGNYSLVYCGRLSSGNIFALVAPNKGESNATAYIYVEFNAKGELINNHPFTAPSPAIAIFDYQEKNGKLYFVAGSPKKANYYDDIFESYAPIENPGYITSANLQMDRYEKRIYKEEFVNLHLLQFVGGNLQMTSTNPIKDFKSKIVTPPSQKKGTPYEGKKFVVEGFNIAQNGDILVAGQLIDKKIVNGGTAIQYFYYDIVCLHFDASGNLKAQYAVEKMNDDRKSEMFQSKQNFYLSADNNTIYWEILEVKGTKGYGSFMAAYTNSPSFMANYFPRIAKINLQKSTLSEFEVLGNKGKFLLYKNQSLILDTKNNTSYYIGHDEDYKKVWLGKCIFQ